MKRSDNTWVILLAIIVVVIVLAIISLGVSLSKGDCKTEAERLGLEWRYSLDLCEVNTTDFGWWDIEDYKTILAIRQMKEPR